ncbi:MAG: hypothetical protein ABIJ83_03575 [Patescibacteria group bacterium]
MKMLVLGMMALLMSTNCFAEGTITAGKATIGTEAAIIVVKVVLETVTATGTADIFVKGGNLFVSARIVDGEGPLYLVGDQYGWQVGKRSPVFLKDGDYKIALSLVKEGVRFNARSTDGVWVNASSASVRVGKDVRKVKNKDGSHCFLLEKEVKKK